MENETVVETGIGQIYKVGNGIRSSLEIQVNYDFSFMSCNFCKNLGNTRIILIKNFSRSKSVCGKAQSTTNNELFKQSLSSVVIVINEQIVQLEYSFFLKGSQRVP